jgi:hypothetical protein
LLKCGPNYTCLYKKSENKIKLFASDCKFKEKVYEINKEATKLECATNIIALTCSNAKVNVVKG